jgi:hypothetical protein
MNHYQNQCLLKEHSDASHPLQRTACAEFAASVEFVGSRRAAQGAKRGVHGPINLPSQINQKKRRYFNMLNQSGASAAAVIMRLSGRLRPN